MIYPAITLHQPWASLIACGAKQFETRAYPPPAKHIGQRIAIHAGARKARYADVGADTAEAIMAALGHGAVNKVLPFGAVVCTAVLAAAYRLEDCGQVVEWRGRPMGRHPTHIPIDLFGDYSPGRWAWLLTDVEVLAEPVPAKGKQGWWRWEDRRAAA